MFLLLVGSALLPVNAQWSMDAVVSGVPTGNVAVSEGSRTQGHFWEWHDLDALNSDIQDGTWSHMENDVLSFQASSLSTKSSSSKVVKVPEPSALILILISVGAGLLITRHKIPL